MRSLLGLLLCALLCAGASSCGSSSGGATAGDNTSTGAVARDATATSSATPLETQADRDRDNDGAGGPDDSHNTKAWDFGQAAAAPDRRAVTALIKRYYAAALAGDGASACTMLYSTLAESIPEDYGGPAGPEFMRGATSCRAGLERMFKHEHARLALIVPRLTVTHLRLIGHHGTAILGFGRFPERELLVAREGHVWRISALIDKEVL